MPFALFDLDGTLTHAHIWGGLMAYFRQHGRKRLTHTLYLAVHYPLYGLRKARLLSEYAFRYRWSSDLGWYLRGESESKVTAIGEWVAHTYLKGTWRASTMARLKAHREQGDTVALVSAAPLPLVAAIARALDVPHAIGTRFAVDAAGRYTGQVIPPPALDAHKWRLAQAYFAAHSLPLDPAQTTAYADSITDLALLEAVAHPVAAFPDAALEAVARARGWEILR